MPLPVNTYSLSSQMRSTLAEIEKQIESIKEDYLSTLPVEQKPDLENVYRTKYADGHFLLTDILVAKANLQAGLANLQAANTKR